MITILFGPGGSGKSYLQVMIVIRQLRETRRNIVTNLSLDLAKLNHYLEKEYPSESLNAVERIRILTVAETKEFWKIRGRVKWVGPGPYDYAVEKGDLGVCYIIDEAGAAGFSFLGSWNLCWNRGF